MQVSFPVSPNDEQFTDQGIAALKAGDQQRARTLLIKAVQSNPNDERAWLWLSGAVSDDAERRYCLERVQAINPQNGAAKQGLALLPSGLISKSPLPEAATTPLPTEPPAAPATPPPVRASELSSLATTTREQPAPAEARIQPAQPAVAAIDAATHTRSLPESAFYTPPALATSASRPISFNDVRVQQETINPWFSIWLSPRRTMRWIVDHDPTGNVLVLAILGGVGQFLARAAERSLGDQVPIAFIFFAAIIIGPISGLFGLYLMGILLQVTGSWLGGHASRVEVRSALAWSQVPLIWAMLLWIPELALYREELFTSFTPRIASNPLLALSLVGFAVVEIVISIWALVVFLKCLGEVHGFSAWRALGAAVLAPLLLIVPILCLIFGAITFITIRGG